MNTLILYAMDDEIIIKYIIGAGMHVTIFSLLSLYKSVHFPYLA